MERNSGQMELKSCSFGALEVAVNFMYHQPIPNGFSGNIELLHLADMFMMNDLKEEAATQLARILSEENYLETSQAAELYHAESLISECAEFVLENVVKVNWEEVGKLPKVISAMVLSQSPIFSSGCQDQERSSQESCSKGGCGESCYKEEQTGTVDPGAGGTD